MHTTTLDLALGRAEHDLRHVDRRISMPDWVIRAMTTISAALTIKLLRGFAESLSNDVIKLHELARMVDDSSEAKLIDPDGAKAAHFETLLSSLKRLHTKASGILAFAEASRKTKLVQAVAQFTGVCEEFHEAAAKLSWAIAEHDASHAPRLSGFTASNAEELEAMLDRLVSKA